MNWDFSEFHFIRPLYLTAIPALMFIWWILGRSLKSTAWDKVINKEMLKVLRVQAGSGITFWRWSLLFAWILMVLASAGPSWTKIPAPSYKNQLATVVLLDLSRSMLAEDLSPNRLTRAKFKLIDLLRQQKDGQIALIAYAGDAYAVTPLTDDPRTIEALLPALNPSVMPSQGSNAEAAVAMASQLLRDAKIAAGNILLLTDGVSPEAQRTIRSDLPNAHTLSIIGIGSSQATPIPVARGGFLKASNGELVLTKLNVAELRELAQSSNGAYANIQNDDSDISELLSEKFDAGTRQQKNDPETDNRFDSWADMGHWLIILVLPFAAFAFRRGLVFMLPLIFAISLFSPETSYAQESPEPTKPKFEWSHLWKTADQRAADLFAKGDYENAAKTFKNEAWKASSQYKSGDYETAQKQFEQNAGIDSQYNKGNSLALQGQFEEAIKLYESVLEQNPNHEDAAFNKKLIEQIQDQQNQSQDQQNQDQQNQDQNQENKDQDSKDNQQQKNQSDQKSDDQNDSQDKQDQENSEQQDSQDQQPEQQKSDNSEQQQDKEEQSEKSEQKSEQEKKEQEKQEKEQQAKNQAQQEKEQSEQAAEEKNIEAVDTPKDLGDENEQWLRAIPDDPSGFLRKKFKYQKDQRRKQGGKSDNDANQAERY